MKKYYPLATLFLLSMLYSSSHADELILYDDFNREVTSTTANFSNFTNWSVITGTVDIVESGDENNIVCDGSGYRFCVDLDGSTGDPGILISKSFDLEPGTYNLSFSISGNQRDTTFDTDTVTVSVGNVYSETFTKNETDPFERVIRQIAVSSSESAIHLTFENDGSDNYGIILDEVLFRKLPPASTCTSNALDWVQKFYIAYYGRPADPDGHDYWACRMDSEGGQLSSIIDAFGQSDEFLQRIGTLTTAEQIKNIYLNLFNRTPDSSGISYWETELSSGRISLASMAIAILSSALNDDAAIVENKKSVADVLSERVRNGYGCSYSDEHISTATSILAMVNNDSETINSATEIINDYFCLNY